MTLTSLVAVGCLASVYATKLVPSVDGPMPIPIWVLVPPTLAMFSSLGVANALPAPQPPPAVLVAARLLWLAVVVGSAAASAGLVAASTGYGGLVEATLLLTALTFATSTVVGRGSVVVGAAVVVFVLTYSREFAHLTADSALLYVRPAWHWAAAALAACGCAGFLHRGARSAAE
ncbi:hypothetical protein [Nocardioides sp.]|uniref:hypothetical protein n=1 Tax=Nocardioides sp. TaxID=35761 RepID=UPI003D0BF5D2